jgi:hypothetical protein
MSNEFKVQKQKSGTEAENRNQKQKSEFRSGVFILCGVITVTFRVLLWVVVMKCYNYSKNESVIANCSSAC